jgi:multicomponent Na+:H+ antiporter subunit B
MSSLILQTTARLLHPLLLLFSVFIMVRGHNAPGGGFAGGLVAAAAFALYTVTFDPASARQALKVSPATLTASGLLLALSSGLPALLRGQPFMTSLWTKLPLPAVGALEVGTVLLFDAGVYLVVIGTTLLIIFSLAEED